MTFAVGGRVFLSRRNLTTKSPSAKLDHRFVGPFPISTDRPYRLICHGSCACRLEVPHSHEIHELFMSLYYNLYASCKAHNMNTFPFLLLFSLCSFLCRYHSSL
ncbi:hypothetical protein V1509DRAFT_633492 [Lipomyces kononenkoae]